MNGLAVIRQAKPSKSIRWTEIIRQNIAIRLANYMDRFRAT